MNTAQKLKRLPVCIDDARLMFFPCTGRSMKGHENAWDAAYISKFTNRGLVCCSYNSTYRGEGRKKESLTAWGRTFSQAVDAMYRRLRKHKII